ncbi:MAG TPA: nitrilase-related carbon-nitrogen hydrolase, partial [Actinomycetota bacterium]
RITSLADAAGDTTAALIGFTERDRAGHLFNSATFLQGGAVVHTHRKVHLASYDIWEEASHFTPGSSVRAVDSSVGRAASLICYDLWHPGLVLVAVRDGARLLLAPSNSIDRRFSDQASNRDQWRIITRCYASLFECYVVFVNRVGAEGDLVFWGGSHIVDPHGRVVAEAPNDDEAMVVVDIDLDEVDRRRRETPLVQDAHLDLVIRELERIVIDGRRL